MRIVSLSAPLILLGVWAGAATLDELKARHDEANFKYDAAAADAVLADAQAYAAANPGDEAHWAVVHAALLVAQLRRYEFGLEEQVMEGKEKRQLGKVIDAAADAALALLEAMPESSEQQRIIADLLGCKIRSDFKGKQLGDRMTAAANRSVELDPSNPMALVSACKRLIFASDRQGGDLAKGTEYLNQALALDPKLVTAYVMRGFAHEHADKLEEALADWKKAIALNPNCKPAIENAERVKRLLDIRKANGAAAP